MWDGSITYVMCDAAYHSLRFKLKDKGQFKLLEGRGRIDLSHKKSLLYKSRKVTVKEDIRDKALIVRPWSLTLAAAVVSEGCCPYSNNSLGICSLIFRNRKTEVFTLKMKTGQDFEFFKRRRRLYLVYGLSMTCGAQWVIGISMNDICRRWEKRKLSRILSAYLDF